jgi:alanine racemase
MTRGIRMKIDRSAFKHNLRRVRELAPDSRVMAVVKCDGYGHGLVEAARGLSNPDAFAVESLEEALRLRETGFRQDVVLLSGFHGVSELDTIAFRRFCPVVHHQWQIDALAKAQTLVRHRRLDQGRFRDAPGRVRCPRKSPACYTRWRRWRMSASKG